MTACSDKGETSAVQLSPKETFLVQPLYRYKLLCVSVGIFLAPVSYTHLDVYKRQGLAYSNDPDDIERYKLFPGDVLFNRTNSAALVGKTAIYRGEHPAIYAGYLRCV